MLLNSKPPSSVEEPSGKYADQKKHLRHSPLKRDVQGSGYPAQATQEDASGAPIPVSGRRRECSDEYPPVVLTDKVRVIECRHGIQWIVQIAHGGQWHSHSFCRNRDALVELCVRRGLDDDDIAVLRALPEWCGP